MNNCFIWMLFLELVFVNITHRSGSKTSKKLFPLHLIVTMRHLCISTSPFNIFISTISLSTILINLSFIIIGIKWSLKAKSKLFKSIHWFTSIMLLIAGIMFPIHQLLDMQFSKYCDNPYRIELTVPMSTIPYMLSLIGICCLYLVRLILSFKNTKYAISKYVTILLIFFLLIQFILISITTYFAICCWSDLTNIDTHAHQYILHRHYMEISSVLFAILNTTYLIVLLCLFLKKILDMSKCIKEVEFVTDNLIKPCIMYLICVSVSIIALFIVFIFNIIRNVAIEDTNEFYMLHLTLITVDILVNTLSVNIQFESAKYVFDIFCKCCNLYILTLVVKKRKIQQKKIEICSKSSALQTQQPQLNIHNDVDSTTDITTNTTDTTESTSDNAIKRPELHKSVTTLHESETVPKIAF
eukprot:185658_1